MRFALSQRWIGIFEMMGAGLAFGTLGVCGKRAFEAGLSPGEFLFFRFAISSLTLGAWFLVRNPGALRLPRRAMWATLPLGTIGYGFFSWTYFRGLEGLPASLAVLILFTFPAIVAMGGALFLKERLNLWHWGAMPVMAVGLWLLVGVEPIELPLGSLAFVGASAILYAAYILVSKKMLHGVSPFASLFWIQLFAAAFVGALWVRPSTFSLLSGAWPILLITAWIGGLLAMGLFLSGLQKLKSFEAGILCTAEPLTGVVLSAMFLGERLTGWQALGGLGVLGASVLVALAERNLAYRPDRREPS